MIDASVVDLPEPVGPVTSTSPRGFFDSSVTTGGRPSSSKVRILKGMVRKAPATAPRCMKMLARKRESALHAEGQVELVVLLELVPSARR